MSVIIFGRSLFIDQVDVNRLITLYDTIGFNHFGEHYDVDYLFMNDRYFPHGQHKQIFYPAHLSATVPKPPPSNGVRFHHVRQDTPVLKWQEKDGVISLGFKLFTPSAAVNWSILKGYKKAYLVGIDHVESNTQFKHHDGQDAPSAMSVASHQKFKQFIYNCARHIKIYQTNPAVAKDWRLPFMDIEALYDPQV